MTNHERINKMTASELSTLMNVYTFEDSEWFKWFAKNKCAVCPTQKATIPHINKVEMFHECDFEGICPLIEDTNDIIKMWLESDFAG